jgi:hypothetical protein
MNNQKSARVSRSFSAATALVLAAAVTTGSAGIAAPGLASPVTAQSEMPMAEGVPTITGTPAWGQTLAADPGTWAPTDAQYTYQWFYGGTPIPGATNATYVPDERTVGYALTVQVSATAPGYILTLRESAETSRVTAQEAVENFTAPRIDGLATQGYVQRATPGTWTPGTTVSYQWLRNGVPVPGATTYSYKLGADDYSRQISVRVTGSLPGRTPTMATSALTPRVNRYIVHNTALPVITGTPARGQVLSASTGTWRGDGPWTLSGTYSYQWYRAGEPIIGATAARYTLVAADVGSRILVKVTYRPVDYTPRSVVSGETRPVTLPLISNTALPTFTGTLKAGYLLTSRPGTWTPGVTLSYQWQRNGVNITGATAPTYRLSTLDRGKGIRVKVIARKADHTSTYRYSATKVILYSR